MEIKGLSGQNLQRLRKKSGLTQEALSKCLGICKQNVSVIETGRRPITDKMLGALCDILSCSPDEFYKTECYDDPIDGLLRAEMAKMDKAKKASLYATAVALNSDE